MHVGRVRYGPVREADYHAIISDLNMPAMNGLELLREIKTVRPWTPLLLMTGNDSEDLVREAAKAGAYDFIKKPINRDMLVLAVKRALEAYQWRREREKDTILCVEGLEPSATIGSFRDRVAQVGRVRRLRLVLDTYDKSSGCAYGYVEFATPSEAEQAKRSLTSGALCEERLHVSFCRDAFRMDGSNPTRPHPRIPDGAW